MVFLVQWPGLPQILQLSEIRFGPHKNAELGIVIVAADKNDIECGILLTLAIVLVLDLPSSTALFDSPIEDSCKEANEILRTLDA